MLKTLKAALRKIKIYNIIGHSLIIFALFNTFFITNSELWINVLTALLGFICLLYSEISKSLENFTDGLCNFLGIEFDDSDDQDETEQK